VALFAHSSGPAPPAACLPADNIIIIGLFYQGTRSLTHWRCTRGARTTAPGQPQSLLPTIAGS